jgi:two-component system response regulator
MKNRPPAILIIEDDPDEKFLVVHAFQEISPGDPGQLERNGLESIAYLNRAPGSAVENPLGYPASALTTVTMHGTTNSQQAGTGKVRLSSIPNIVFSSSSDLEDIQKSYVLGGTSYHKRPANMRAVRGHLKQLYAYWTTRQTIGQRRVSM